MTSFLRLGACAASRKSFGRVIMTSQMQWVQRSARCLVSGNISSKCIAFLYVPEDISLSNTSILNKNCNFNLLSIRNVGDCYVVTLFCLILNVFFLLMHGLSTTMYFMFVNVGYHASIDTNAYSIINLASTCRYHLNIFC